MNVQTNKEEAKCPIEKLKNDFYQKYPSKPTTLNDRRCSPDLPEEFMAEGVRA